MTEFLYSLLVVKVETGDFIEGSDVVGDAFENHPVGVEVVVYLDSDAILCKFLYPTSLCAIEIGVPAFKGDD